MGNDEVNKGLSSEERELKTQLISQNGLKQPAETLPQTAIRKGPPKLDGEVLAGRYQVRGVLGRGSFGEVLEVLDQKTDTVYALKRELYSGPDETKSKGINFDLESQLSHPHIAATCHFEIDARTGQALILMELVRGSDMAGWLKAKRQELGDEQAALPPEIALGMARQIADALDYAHHMTVSGSSRKGILHRDLKPANIMVVSDEEDQPGVPAIKVVDFGLAKQIQASIQGLSVVGVQNEIAGSLAYMAPEQWEGRTLTPGVDQWALAVMIYEMLAGRLPFEAPTWLEMMRQIQEANPPRPIQLSGEQWQALKKAFASDRRFRYPTCTAFVEAMGAAKTDAGLETLVLPAPQVDPNLQPAIHRDTRTSDRTSPFWIDPEEQDVAYVVGTMKARDMAKNGHWEKAESALEDIARSRGPESVDALRDGVRKLLSRHWMDALEASEEGTTDTRAALRFRLSIVKARHGNLEEVFALARESGSPKRYLTLMAQAVRAAARQGAGIKVRKQLDRVVGAASQAGPSMAARAFLELGIAQMHVGDTEAAATLFHKVSHLCLEGHTPQSVPPPILSLRSFLESRAHLANFASDPNTSSAGLRVQDAFAEVAVAQAEAGLPEDALATLGLAQDPWLISLAKSRIVATLLSAGRYVEAQEMADAIQHKQAKARSLAALAAFHARRGDREAAHKTMEDIDPKYERAPVMAQMAAMNILEGLTGVAKNWVDQAVFTVQEAKGTDLYIRLLLDCARPLLAFHFDQKNKDTSFAQPFLAEAERAAERIDNHSNAFVALLMLVDMSSSVWRIPSIQAVGGGELDRYIQKGFGKLRMMKHPGERMGAASALGFAIAKNNRCRLEGELLSTTNEEERIFARLGCIEGMV